jgi:biotin operon repressor
LGRLEINTDEIADALSLPVLVVNQAISSLKKKGVKITNG